LRKVIDNQVVQAGDLKEFFVGKLNAEVSRQIKKLIDKKCLSLKMKVQGSIFYVLTTTILLRGVIKALGEKGFFCQSEMMYKL